MSTVDFWADPVGGSGGRISIGNGLFGPATTAFHRLVDMIQDGTVEGTADEAIARARVPGSLLRELLAGLGSDTGAVVVRREGHSEEDSLQSAIDDGLLYVVQAIEV